MACVTRGTDFDAILPKSLFIQGGVDDANVLSKLASKLTLNTKPTAAPVPVSNAHSFTILKRVLEDSELGPGAACNIPKPNARGDENSTDGGFPLLAVLANKGDKILKYAEMWAVNGEDQADLKKKLEELAWVATMIYGVAGYQEGKEFKSDFFLYVIIFFISFDMQLIDFASRMHIVTSSLFLPSYVHILQPSSITLLLRTYFASALAVWISRGRPPIPITSFYERSSPNLPPPGPKPTPAKETLAVETSIYPNTWLPILQSTILHPNEHLCKLQRALAHYSALYGTTEAGTWKKEGIELEGLEKLDGTLFARVAGLTMGRLGWLREGDQKGEWDFDGLWPDETTGQK